MFDTIWSQIQATGWLEWFGTVTGVVGVYLSIKEKVTAWLLFIACYSAYVYLSYQADLFAALLMNTVFIGISVYGWLSWSKTTQVVGTARTIAHVSKQKLLIAAAFILVGSSSSGWALNNYTQAYLPYLDAFAMCCAFTAQWMLSRKYIENWICWIIADIIYVYLWGIQGYYVSVGLFTIFIILAVKGWFEWKGSLRTTQA